MIDFGSLHRKVELTYKDLYELTFVFPKILRETDTEKVKKWAREHPLITDIDKYNIELIQKYEAK